MATGTITKVSNDSASGYCKFPDGTLLMYGGSSMTAGQWTQWVYYPVTPNGLPSVTASSNDSQSYASVTVAADGVQLQTSNADRAKTIYWLAIGRWK